MGQNPQNIPLRISAIQKPVSLVTNKYLFSFSFFPSSPACKIEVPERLTVSYEALTKAGLADRCLSVPVREATDADILLVHRSVF